MCVASSPLQIIPNREKESTITHFLSDILMKLPAVCGKRLQISKDTPFDTKSLNIKSSNASPKDRGLSTHLKGKENIVSQLESSDKYIDGLTKDVNAAISLRTRLTKIHQIHQKLNNRDVKENQSGIQCLNTMQNSCIQNVENNLNTVNTVNTSRNPNFTVSEERTISTYFKIQNMNSYAKTKGASYSPFSMFEGALTCNKMSTMNYFEYLMRYDAESPVDQDDHSTLPVDLISADEFAVLSGSSASVIDSTSPIQSTASMSPVPSTSHGIEENNDDYRYEASRRWSFRSCPKISVDPVSLAAAGFYYTGEIDRVRCFECQVMVNNWSVGDIPMQIHEMCSPECRFIRNEHCDNVPVGVDPDIVLLTKRRNRNITCRYGLQYHESFDFNDHQFLRYLRCPTAYELSRLGLQEVKKAENVEYATYESRLNSFESWPTYMKQTSEDLADAGFYYTRIDDFTTCYHCGIGIGNWRPEEVPWEEHAILSPSCCYLLAVRGWEYVNSVIGHKIYETPAEAPIEIADGNPERSNSENDSENEMTLREKIASLEEENQAMKDARSCKVCMERESTICFLPCGHLATCQYCSLAFKKCIICGNNIKAIRRIFWT
ncbi:E3 ubiquitin-protein ligase XIAP-like [Bombus vosnesenskii]|uniref:E3 ubiquitin-protein ligase XIAP-like n=1 Tax=Bombus vosnesenskii TaxID=207650 RepID=A0A6J3L5D6_9HYME|nr:E3 ubiquitin-protein ligase XIAP-like [Bombus vosnesenskii]